MSPAPAMVRRSSLLIFAFACVRHAAGAFAAASAAAGSSRVAQSRVAAPAQMGPGALGLDLTGKVAFVAGVADSTGYGWAICKALAEAGCTVTVGTWPPVLGIFEKSLKTGKFDEDMILSDGSKMEIAKVYPLDAVFDSPEDIPEDVKVRRRRARQPRARTPHRPRAPLPLARTPYRRLFAGCARLLPWSLLTLRAHAPPSHWTLHRTTSATRASTASPSPRSPRASRRTMARLISSSTRWPTGRR